MTDRRLIPNLFQEASSGCLLPLLLLVYISISIAGIIGSILIILGCVDPPEGLILSVKEVYVLVLVLSSLYLLSIIGIIQEKESGVAGFVLVTVVLFVVSVFSGGSPKQEINTFIPIVILLLLLRLDDWKEFDHKQLVECYLEVREAEISNPQIALKLYRRLERANRDVNPALVLIGTLFMPLAYLLGQWLNTKLSLNSNLVESITLAFVGIGPVVFVFDWWSIRAKKRSVRYESEIENATNDHTVFAILDRFLVFVFKRFLFPVLVLFADWLELVLCAIIAGISAIIITVIMLLPHKLVSLIYDAPPLNAYTLLESIAPIISFWLFILLILISAAEPRLKPISRVLPELPVALKTNLENLISFLTAIVLLLIFITPYMLSPYAVRLDTRGELIQHAMAGALLGYTFSAKVKFRIFNVFVKLGQARCLRRIGRQLEGFYIVYRLSDTTNSRSTPAAYQYLIESFLVQLDPLKPSCEHCAQDIRSEARQNSSNNLPYFELFNDVLERDL